jgi:hypothetical protein
VIRIEPLEADGPTSGVMRQLAELGEIPGYRTSLVFAYARGAAPGDSPDYQPDWPADAWPDLIRITYLAQPEDNAARPQLTLQTSVVPGIALTGGLTAREDDATTATTGLLDPRGARATEAQP